MATLMEKVVEILGSVKTPELAADLVLRLAREEHFREFERERERDQARTRKRQQRDRDRDNSVTEPGQQRDPGVTVPPTPPSGSVSSGSGSPDPSEPDQRDPHSDEPAGGKGRYSPEFLKVWSWYPRKVGIEAAWQAWLRERPPLAECQASLQWQRLTHKWRVEKVIPNLERWIDERRWLDERDISVTGAPHARPVPAAPKTPPEKRGWTNGGSQ